jgi:non-ribosomal peptide synthetase component E (peptide arylation enzyme)
MRIREGQPCLHSDAAMAGFHAEGHWGERLLVDFFDERALQTPQKIAIVESHRSLTYAEVRRLTENLAASLIRLGVVTGDVVAIQAPNWAELVMVHLATDRIGAVFVPLSEGFRERELQHLLGSARTKVFFCAESVRGFRPFDLIQALRGTLPSLAHVVALRADAVTGRASFDELADWNGWRTDEAAGWLTAHRGSADSPSHVMVSSGTTGLPRCSLFSDNNTVVKLLRQYVRAAGVGSDDIAAALAPAGTGATGYNYPILTMLLLGGTSVMLEHWSGSNLDAPLALIEKHRCTLAVVVPAQLAMLVGAPQLARYDVTSIRVITNAGAKLAPSVAESAERLFGHSSLGCKVQSIYGTSEAGATAMTRVDDADEKRRATVGLPLDGQDVLILDEAGALVPSGAIGEVCWRGPNKSYGFLNDPDGSAKVWDEAGLLYSGDLGLIDAEGYLNIVGRKKDMIIRGGQNVNPGAIEEVLLAHPAIAEVAVVPIADVVLGERIAACVVARGEPPALESLKTMVRESGLAAWHQPELLVLLPELPRNAGGKIDKAALARYATESTATIGARSPK